MNDGTGPGGARPVCAAGVPPEDVAAWALDGEESDVTSLTVHVPDCAACRAVVAEVSGSRGVADALRAEPLTAPPRVAQRAVGRIRTEATMLTILRALGGGWLRVAQALPDYARAPSTSRDDTGEMPALEDTGEFDEIR